MALPASSVSSLHDIVVDLYIGLAPDDLGEPQQVLITVHVHHCVGPSIHNDDVVGTFDLQCLSAAIRSAVANQRYDLIESVVDDVARITTSFPGCESVEVDVRKPRTTGCLLVRIPADYPPFTVILSVGSNINPVENIPRAIRALRKMFDVRRVSKAYATPPVGEGAGVGLPVTMIEASDVKSNFSGSRGGGGGQKNHNESPLSACSTGGLGCG